MAIISIFFLLFLSISPSFSAFVAPITKHHYHSSPYYTLSIYLQTPLQPTDLLLDLAAPVSSVDCTRNYSSTTSRSVPCNSPLCHSLQFYHRLNNSNCHIHRRQHSTVPGGGCTLLPPNSFALVDALALPTTDGRNPGQLSVIPEFVFSCSNAPPRSLKGRAKLAVAGSAGMGLSEFSLPAQVSSATAAASLGLFALCLSGSPSAPGVAFFELAAPYYFLPGIDVSNSLNYTPLFSYPVTRPTVRSSTPRPNDDYFIGVKSIKVNGNPIRINETLLTVDQKGRGGTRISTINPYTVLERSIYKAFIKAFVNESAAMNLTLTDPVKPFDICYQTDDILETHVGPTIPTVDLVMQNDDVFWRIYGKNSMVRVVDEGFDAWCLGFVDGGLKPSSSIVIGGHQMEDNLVQFDLGAKRLGFSSTLLVHRTMCANFNFTTNS